MKIFIKVRNIFTQVKKVLAVVIYRDLDLRDFSFTISHVFRSAATVKAMQGWLKAPKDFTVSCIWINISKKRNTSQNWNFASRTF